MMLKIARELLDIVLELIPHDVAKDELDDAAVRRANAIANLAESLKFHGETKP